MLTAAASHSSISMSRPIAAPLRAVYWNPSQAEKSCSLPDEIRWLRAADRKVALSRAYGYGTGGDKVDFIALDLGVSRGKAHKMLSSDYDDAISDARLARVRDRNPSVWRELLTIVSAPAMEAA